jgi:hypothetical protein
VFQPRSGTERWHCHACGAGGTAIDLVMVTQNIRFLEALELLARRVDVAEGPWHPLTPGPRTPLPPEPTRPTAPHPALAGYVAACETWLWSPAGAPMQRWLAGRRLDEDVLRANRVGADPGPRALPREPGLPRAGPAVLFPLLDPDGRVFYLQARYLRPNGRKYDNPSADLVPVSPRLGEIRLAGPARRDDLVVVCEGIPDALTAAGAGYRAVAVLGAGLPDERLAAQLVALHPKESLLVAFDADPRGRAGSERLVDLLSRAGADDRVHTLSVPEAAGDLNGWAQTAGDGFAEGLCAAIRRAAPPLFVAGLATTSHQEKAALAHDHEPDQALLAGHQEMLSNPAGLALDDVLETLAYQHLLLDHPLVVTQNLEEIAGAIEAWRSGAAPPDLHPEGKLTDTLEQIGYHHLLADDEDGVRRVLGEVARAVGHWNDLVPDRTGEVLEPSGVPQDDLGLPASLLPDGASLALDASGLDL